MTNKSSLAQGKYRAFLGKRHLAYLSSGKAKYKLGNHLEAIANFNKAIALNKNCAIAYYCRAVVRGELGNYLGSMKDYRKASIIWDKFTVVHKKE